MSERPPLALSVITGLSGGGKSQAMGAFEDAGWFCVDNLPPQLLPSLAELFSLPSSAADKVAVACDARGGTDFGLLEEELDRFAADPAIDLSVLFLEAHDDTLLRRFSESRRRHPMAGEGRSLRSAIDAERSALDPLRARADLVIDTSDQTIWDLRDTILSRLIDGGSPARLQVTFMSFGFKNGSPREADLVFDVRFLRNPHYDPELRPHTGLDPQVADFISADPDVGELKTRLADLLRFLLPRYAGEGKSHLTVAIGCTGGRHRSVFLTRWLADQFSDDGFEVSVVHRDISREGSS